MTLRVVGVRSPVVIFFGDTRACAMRACGWRARVLDRRVRVAGACTAAGCRGRHASRLPVHRARAETFQRHTAAAS